MEYDLLAKFVVTSPENDEWNMTFWRSLSSLRLKMPLGAQEYDLF